MHNVIVPSYSNYKYIHIYIYIYIYYHDKSNYLHAVCVSTKLHVIQRVHGVIDLCLGHFVDKFLGLKL